MTQFTVFNISEKNRLDKYFHSIFPQHSRAKISELIEQGNILVDDKKVKPSYRLSNHQTVCAKDWQKTSKTSFYLEPTNIPLNIVYDDEHLAVINKPQGLAVHPGAGVKESTLVHALLWHFPKMACNSLERPGIVHRLDKDTAGLLVVAKSDDILEKLSKQFMERKVEKIYQAFVYGEPGFKELEIISGHLRHPHNRLKFFTKLEPPKSPSSHVKVAHSHIKVLSKNHGICHMEIKIHTGRTHQIRAHLADREFPILGDTLYAAPLQSFSKIHKKWPESLHKAILKLPGQALFAAKLSFTHPVHKKVMTFEAPIPENLEKIKDFMKF